MLHPKLEQARIASNILNSYNGVQKLTRPIINQVEFEKAVIEDKIQFYSEEVLKSWSTKMLDQLEQETDSIKKAELDSRIQEQIKPLVRIDVVFDSVVKSVYVDILDQDKKYKDNSLTQKLNLVGKSA